MIKKKDVKNDTERLADILDSFPSLNATGREKILDYCEMVLSLDYCRKPFEKVSKLQVLEDERKGNGSNE